MRSLLPTARPAPRPAGNRLTKQEAGSQTVYTYDAANQLLVVTPPSGDPTTHTWDAAGNLHVESTGDVYLG